MLVWLFNYPNIVGSGWVYIFDWNPPSVTIMQFVLPIVFASTAWYTYTKKPKRPSKKAVSEKVK
jgi:hypothetical protein